MQVPTSCNCVMSKKKALCVFLSQTPKCCCFSIALVARMHIMYCHEGWLLAGYDRQNSCVYNPLSAKCVHTPNVYHSVQAHCALQPAMEQKALQRQVVVAFNLCNRFI